MNNLFSLTERQRWAVTMALGSGQEALGAFMQWREGVIFDDLPVAEHRLLPLASQNLEEIESLKDDDLIAKFTKASRVYWLKSQLRTRAAARMISQLHARGIPSMLIKGSAVVWHMDGDLRSRPMHDIDLLVRPEHVAAALEAFLDAGFTLDGVSMSSRDLLLLMEHRHAIGLRDPDGMEIDLHWHPVACSRNEQTAERFWSRAVQGSLVGSPCLVASREDCLVHAIAHAFGNRPFVESRWIADVYILATRSALPFEWDDVITTARITRTQEVVRQALLVAMESTDLFVADLVFQRLKSASSLERFVARPRLGNDGSARPATRTECFLDAYDEYLSGDIKQVGGMDRLRGFLSDWWSLGSGSVLSHAFFVALGRPPWLRRRLRVSELPFTTQERYLQVGERLWFTLGADGVDHLLRGWSNPEPHGTWSQGSESNLRLGLRDAKGLVLTVTPFLAPGHSRVDLEVVVNNRYSRRFMLEGQVWETRELRVDLPPGLIHGDANTDIRFVIRRPMSPAEACFEPGTRPIGVSLASIETY